MTKNDFLARYAGMESESPWHGAKHYGLDTGTIVSENVRNGYCTYGFRRI